MTRHVALAALLALSACHASSATHEPSVPSAARAPRVDVIRVEPEALSGAVFSTGTAMAVEAADLAAPAGAICKDIAVQPGQEVRKGQELVTYRSDRVSMGRMQADASALAAETQASHAEAELARLTPLAARGTIAQAQLDGLKTQATAARAQAEAARSAARSASAAAGDLVVRAPFDGVVTAVHAQIGETATGGPAVRVADLSALELTVSVHERDLPHVRAGGQADIVFPNLGVQATGEITWVGLEIDRRTRTASVQATVDNRELRLPSGAYAEATLRAETGREALVVPASAVTGPDDGRFVWVVREQTASKQPVLARPLPDGRVEVIEGLQSGDLVVASRTSAVTEGPVDVQGGAL